MNACSNFLHKCSVILNLDLKLHCVEVLEKIYVLNIILLGKKVLIILESIIELIIFIQIQTYEVDNLFIHNPLFLFNGACEKKIVINSNIYFSTYNAEI